jgi:hypothetical protein
MMTLSVVVMKILKEQPQHRLEAQSCAFFLTSSFTHSCVIQMDDSVKC